MCSAKECENYAREWVRLAITENHRSRNRTCIGGKLTIALAYSRS